MMLLIKEKCRKYIEERNTRQKRRVEKGIEEKKNGNATGRRAKM